MNELKLSSRQIKQGKRGTIGGDRCVHSMGEIFLPCIRKSNHRIAHFKYLTILFVSSTSVQLRGELISELIKISVPQLQQSHFVWLAATMLDR